MGVDGRDRSNGCRMGRVLCGVAVERTSCGEEQGEKVTVNVREAWYLVRLTFDILFFSSFLFSSGVS